MLKEHPLREMLTHEVHARLPESLSAPVRASHLAMLSTDTPEDQERDRAHVARLCARARVAPPPPDSTHYSSDFGTFRLKWERHTEFSSYTVFRPGAFNHPFAEPALAALPADWLAGLNGQLLVGLHLALMPADAPVPTQSDLVALFGSDSYVGARVAGGAATVWTDFRVHGDGFGRILVRDHRLGRRQAGRVVQRLVEIESYRMLALLALPEARRALPRISALERRLADLAARTVVLKDIEDERWLLEELIQLAADNESLAAQTSFRFSAARAYSRLLERRIAELREVRIEGLQTIGEFMSRRLTPAIHTCEAASARQEALSARVGRASNLLRTRIDIALEAQNRDLLKSMDRRAHLQLRLQETVEGLSVVAISYYLLGLISYFAKGLKAAGLPVVPEVAVGLSLPVVLAIVWKGVRRLREAVVGNGGGTLRRQ